MTEDCTRPAIGARSVRWSTVASALASSLACVLDAPFGVAELLGVVGKERLDRLLGIPDDDVEPGRKRRELAQLHRELRLLVLQRLGGVDDGGPGPGLRYDELGAHVDALLKGRDKPLLRRDRLHQHVALSRSLRPLCVERRKGGSELAEVGCENPIFPLAQRRGHVVRPVDRRDGRERPLPRRRERRLPAKRFGASGRQLVPRRPDVCLGRGPVEFDNNVARLHRGVVACVDRRDPAGLERLDDLDVSRRLELALGGGDDVDPAEVGPEKGDRDQGADNPEERQMHRRSRRLQDFQGRRQELAVGQCVAANGTQCKRAPFDRLRGGQGRRLDGRDGANGLGHDMTSAGWVWRPQR